MLLRVVCVSSFLILSFVCAGAIVIEVDPELRSKQNKHGIGSAFGEIVNPFGGEVDVLWQDPISSDEDCVGNSQAKTLPESIPRKYLARCINPREKIVAPSGEEYHLIKVNRKGSHWEVWPPAKNKHIKNADTVKVYTLKSMQISFNANLN